MGSLHLIQWVEEVREVRQLLQVTLEVVGELLILFMSLLLQVILEVMGELLLLFMSLYCLYICKCCDCII